MSTVQMRETAGAPVAGSPVLDVRNLSVRLHTSRSSVTVVDQVSWSMRAGETLALVGESGCGKTVSAMSLLGLLPAGVVAETGGQALLNGVDLLALDERRLRAVRGREVGVVFQDPLTAFNPVRTIGAQVAEPLRLHRGLTGEQARRRVLELFDEVGIADPALRFNLYPHELSGGMRQRALVAMAVAGEPSLLIADEPTTALDVTMQAQVLELLRRLQRERSMALLLITHDVGVVAGMADTVAVVYAGRVVEYGPTRDVLKFPRHPYTRGLLESVPDPGVPRGTRFETLPGAPPDLAALPTGCSFADRCAWAAPVCSRRPPLMTLGTSPSALHSCACWRAEEQAPATSQEQS
jgi:oligopeptide/dipeptide ABC transporter ATP-binding protein